MSSLSLSPLSFLYRMGVFIRHYLYDHKWLSKKFVTLPVVSIGNVVAGGAGKTQVALFLAQQLAGSTRVAVLSRGYKSRAEHAKHPLHVDVNKHSVKLCGDEPWLLANRLKEGIVLANKNRFKSALEATKLGAQLVVLDDGMQHRKLHRDFELVVIDSHNPFGGGSFLPKGTLREDLKQLKRADLILYMGQPPQSVQTKISSLTSAPTVTFKIEVTETRLLDGTLVSSIQNQPIALFCGIGNPSRFENTLKELGADIVATYFCKDHESIKERALVKFSALARKKGAKWLVCTEKDRVKLSDHHHSCLPIAWVSASLKIVKNQDVWDRTVTEIKQLASVTS